MTAYGVAVLFDDDTERGLLEIISTNTMACEPLTQFGLYSMFESIVPDLFTMEFEAGPELMVLNDEGART